MTFRQAVTAGAAVIMLALVVPAVAPQALAFPYRASSHGSEFWSDRPLTKAELAAVAARVATLVAASPIARQGEPRHIFLTDGGWRWKWLVLQNRGAFGITRPLVEAVILNRSDIASGQIVNGAEVGGRQTLSGVIAHETCHGMLRCRYGLEVGLKPAWLVEGYCDHVARESSLSDAEAAVLSDADPAHPALPYYHGRRRVARALTDNGGDVDALFAAH